MIPKNTFHIVFREEEIEELHRRIQNTRQPKVSSGADWSLGTGSDYLEALLDYWGNRYDWKRKEKELNQYPQFTSEIDGLTIHFFHIRSSHKYAKPLLLTHG